MASTIRPKFNRSPAFNFIASTQAFPPPPRAHAFPQKFLGPPPRRRIIPPSTLSSRPERPHIQSPPVASSSTAVRWSYTPSASSCKRMGTTRPTNYNIVNGSICSTRPTQYLTMFDCTTKECAGLVCKRGRRFRGEDVAPKPTRNLGWSSGRPLNVTRHCLFVECRFGIRSRNLKGPVRHGECF